jgi:hypothetical protein
MYVVALSLPRLSLASRWTLALRLWLITLTDRLCYLVSISSLVVTNPRKRTSVNVVPNAFPATRVSVQKPLSDTSPIEFVQVSCAGLRPLFEVSTDPSTGSRYFERNGSTEFPREAQ